jgi:hypothetical protein
LSQKAAVKWVELTVTEAGDNGSDVTYDDEGHTVRLEVPYVFDADIGKQGAWVLRGDADGTTTATPFADVIYLERDDLEDDEAVRSSVNAAFAKHIVPLMSRTTVADSTDSGSTCNDMQLAADTLADSLAAKFIPTPSARYDMLDAVKRCNASLDNDEITDSQHKELVAAIFKGGP